MSTAALLAELAAAPGPDPLARQAVAFRASRALRPAGAFGRLDELAVFLAGWQRTDCPDVARPLLLLAAGDHGVAARGVSAYPATVTEAIVDAVRAGAATASVLAEEVGARIRVVDAGVGVPTGDIAGDDALDPERFAAAVDAGRDVVASLDCDLLILGEMGIGNTTAAAAVAAALGGPPVERWVGRGSGVDDDGWAVKLAAVEAAVARVAGDPPLEILRRAGGAELAVLLGAAAEARLRSIPVLLDGYATTAAVAPLSGVPGALDHCLASHLSPEPGHRLLLDLLGLRPLLDLGLRLGEGTGGLLAVPLLRMAARAVVDVATFDEWGLQ